MLAGERATESDRPPPPKPPLPRLPPPSRSRKTDFEVLPRFRGDYLRRYNRYALAAAPRCLSVFRGLLRRRLIRGNRRRKLSARGDALQLLLTKLSQACTHFFFLFFEEREREEFQSFGTRVILRKSVRNMFTERRKFLVQFLRFSSKQVT